MNLTYKKARNRAQQVISDEAASLEAISDQIDESIVDIAKMMFDCKGHILVTGAGTSRAIAQRFSHLLSCCGTPALYINASDCLNGSSGAVTENDIVYCISKGGSSREINDFAEIAKKRGAKIIAQTENLSSSLSGLSDHVYRIVAPKEVDPYGMIATGSSLVNGAACDVLCTLLLEMRGYSQEEFGITHPEGAVGNMLASGKQKGK